MQVFEVGGRDVSVCSSCLYVMSADDGSQVSSPVPFLPPGVTSGLQVHSGRLVPQSFLTDLLDLRGRGGIDSAVSRLI